MLFKELLIKKMYKKNLQAIQFLNDLDYKLVEDDSLYVFDETKEDVFGLNALVVGGACIDRCGAKVENLGINFYLDILMPINYALEKSLDCAIYIDTPIEIFNGSENIYNWIICVNRLESFVHDLGEKLSLNIRVIRRDKGVKILDELLQKISLTDKELLGLYDLVPSSKSSNSKYSKDLLLHFRRSILSYLPEYLSVYFDKKIDKVIVVEELSQVKAISKAKIISNEIYPKIYVDMPSISCKNRMHRSNNGKVMIFSDFSKINPDVLFEEFLEKIELHKVFFKLGVTNFKELEGKLLELW